MRQILLLLSGFVLTVSQSQSQSPYQLSYGTYIGGIGSDYLVANSVKTDDEGARYGFYGRAKYSGMPTTENSFQDSSDTRNGYLAIFNDQNLLEFGSYIGGSSLEHNVGSFTFTPDGGVVVVGATWSEDFPIFGANPIQSEHAELLDMFIIKFDNNYDVEWSTFYGGNEDDIPNDVICDQNGNIYVAGSSFSPGLSTPGVYQEEINDNDDPLNDDAVLLKLSPGGNLLWCTYFGGNVNDSFDVLALDSEGDKIYCGGETRSNTGLEDMEWQSEIGGLSDGLLSVFNTELGTLEWATYIGGNGGESVRDLLIDEETGIYMSLYASSSDFFASENTHQTYLNGESDALITSFSLEGELNWSTFYGGSGGESVGSISLRSGHLLISGSTNSSNGIVFNDAIEDQNNASNTVSFLAEFDLNGQILFGTFFLTQSGAGFIHSSKYFRESEVICFGISPEGDFSNYMFSNPLQPDYAGGGSDFILFVFNENPLNIQNQIESEFKFYPNPASSSLTVKLDELHSNLEISLYDSQGTKILKQLDQGGDSLEISVDQIPNGLYFLHVTSESKSLGVQKVLVSH